MNNATWEDWERSVIFLVANRSSTNKSMTDGTIVTRKSLNRPFTYPMPCSFPSLSS
jgi:hypothetical protein